MALRKLVGSRLLPSISNSLGSLSAGPTILGAAGQGKVPGDSIGAQQREDAHDTIASAAARVMVHVCQPEWMQLCSSWMPAPVRLEHVHGSARA